MSVKSVLGRPSSKFVLADTVRTPSGLVGEIIGMAEYHWTWTYRIKFPGKDRTLYRDEKQLTLVKRGTKTRREQLLRKKR